MDYKDYYKILGVSKNASQDDIKSAYRKLAREYHPDVNANPDAEETFKSINEAHEVLSDPEKRRKYNQVGSQWQQHRRQGGDAHDFWSQWGQPATGQRYRPGETNYQTLTPEEFEQFFGGSQYSDFFETLFGNDFQPRGSAQPHRGRDLERAVKITLEEAFHGAARLLSWGSGQRITAKIPPGAETGSRVRLRGQGEPGVNGGEAGDLYLLVEVLPDPRFTRDGDDLKTILPIDIYTLLLGGKIDVPALDKTVSLAIPPETPNDKTFRLRGLGMPNRRNKPRGDLYVTILAELPKNLNDEEKALFQELRFIESKKHK